MVRSIAAALLLCCALPALAEDLIELAPDGTTQAPAQAPRSKAKKKNKTASKSPPPSSDSLAVTPLPAIPPTVLGTARGKDLAQSGTPAPNGKAADNTLPLEGSKPGTGNVKPGTNELSLMDIPGFADLDSKLLKDVSLCIFPFIREDKADSTKISGQNLERMQKIFYDVAKSSPLLKDTIIVGKDAPICGIEDTACIASLGAFTSCTAVLAGRATREDNGFTLRARIIDAKRGKLIAKVNQVIATDDESQMAAWAEGQACRALRVNCVGQVKLDADRPDMRLLIDNKAIERKPGLVPGAPEILTLMPGIYKVRATIGQRTSREAILAVRRNQTDTIYVRQLEDGGIALLLKSELKPNEVPGPSKEFVNHGVRPAKVVGIVAAGLGVVALGVAGQQALHSHSLANDASADYNGNGGYYTPGQLSTASGVGTAKSNATILTAVGAGLLVVGGILFFAF